MRILVFLFIALIALVISAVKRSVGTVMKNEDLRNSSLADEAKTVMDKTAKGISWMEQQWEDSKREANLHKNESAESRSEQATDGSQLPDIGSSDSDKK
jgi:YbbR domain-containing protein